jgi:hypothetical protein
LAQEWNPEFEISHHTHSIANLKLARIFQVPTYVLIRNPIDAISSLVLRIQEETDHRGLDSIIYLAIKRYHQYYNYVQKNIEYFHILDFEEIRKNPPYVLERIRNTYPNKLNLVIRPNDVIAMKKKVFLRIKNHEQKTKQGYKASALPNKMKIILKMNLVKTIKADYKDYLTELENLYQKLIS